MRARASLRRPSWAALPSPTGSRPCHSSQARPWPREPVVRRSSPAVASHGGAPSTWSHDRRLRRRCRASPSWPRHTCRSTINIDIHISIGNYSIWIWSYVHMLYWYLRYVPYKICRYWYISALTIHETLKPCSKGACLKPAALESSSWTQGFLLITTGLGWELWKGTRCVHVDSVCSFGTTVSTGLGQTEWQRNACPYNLDRFLCIKKG